jgi:surface antigen
MTFRALFALGMLALSGCASGALTSGATDPSVSSVAPERNTQQVAAAIVDAMRGGLIGGDVGKELGERDRRLALEAEYRALEHMPSGQPVAWSGSGARGEVVAAAPYRVGSQDCRQYTHTVQAGGQARTARGTACRNADGSWTPLT